MPTDQELIAAANRIITKERKRAEEQDGTSPTTYDADAVMVAVELLRRLDAE